MSTSQDKKYDKILDFLGFLAKDLNVFKETVEKRFDAVGEDMATLKGSVRRIEEQQKITNKSLAILQDADRNRQDDILQLTIRVERLEDHIKRYPAPETH